MELCHTDTSTANYVYEYCTTTIHYNEIDFTNFFFIVTVLFVSPIYNQRVAQIARVELDELVAMYRTVDNIPEDELLDAIERITENLLNDSTLLDPSTGRLR